jgi:hypothetical protein
VIELLKPIPMTVNAIRALIAVTFFLIAAQSSHAIELILVDESHHDQEQVQFGKYKAHMAALIKEIDKSCQLSDAQRKKLSVAAKGAIDRSLAKWKKQHPKRSGDRIIWGGRPQVLLGARIAAFENTRRQQSKAHPATSEPIWTKTLEKTLTAEQKKRMPAINRVHLQQVELNRSKVLLQTLVVPRVK